MSKLRFLFIVCVLLIAQAIQAQKVTSFSVSFKIKNLGTTVSGSFKTGTAAIEVNKTNKSLSTFEGSVTMSSVNTGIKLRDKHLREKEEFFHTSKFPLATMKSVTVEAKENDELLVTWDLTMKGITRRFKTTVIATKLNNVVTYKTTMNINRNEWGIGGKSMTMGDVVTINLVASVTN